jgi:hypothetical protein
MRPFLRGVLAIRLGRLLGGPTEDASCEVERASVGPNRLER